MEKQAITTDNSGKILYGDFLGYIVTDNFGRVLTKNNKMAFSYKPKVFKELADVLDKIQKIESSSTGQTIYKHQKFIRWSYNQPKTPYLV